MLSIITIPIIFCLVLVIINLGSMNKKLKKENQELKKKLQQMPKATVQQTVQQAPRPVQTVATQQAPKPVQTATVSQVQKPAAAPVAQPVQVAPKAPEKPKMSEKERKNITILITGSIFIILAALVFLMSTWFIMPDILKTAVLVMLTGLFFGCSNIARDKFKLEKASKTFFYLAMAYIPICLLSISVFGLIGPLSIDGPGRFIYLMLSGIFVAYIYYITYKKNSSKFLLYGSMLSQIFSIVSFCAIFETNLTFIGIGLLIYNFVLMLLGKDEIFGNLYGIIPIVISVCSIGVFFDSTIGNAFLLLLLALNYFMLDFKKSNPVFVYLFNIVTMIFGLYTIGIFEDVMSKDLCMVFDLVYIVLLYIIENMLLLDSDRKEYSDSLTLVTFGTLGILHLESFFIDGIVKPYVISILQVAMLVLSYVKCKSTIKPLYALLIPVYFVISGINILVELDASYHFYIIFAYLIFAISELVRKDKLLGTILSVFSYLFMAGTYVVCAFVDYDGMSTNVIYSLILLAIYVYSYLRSKNEVFRYFAYIISNYVIFTILSLIGCDSEVFYYIPMISTLGVMLIGAATGTDKDDIYLLFSQTVSFFGIYFSALDSIGEVYSIVALIFSGIIMLDNLRIKMPLYNIVPLIGMIPALFFNEFNEIVRIILMVISVIGVTGFSIKGKKMSVFTLFSGIYLALTCFNLENAYASEVLLGLWAVVHAIFMSTGRNFYKFVAYLAGLFIYNTAISDLGLTEFTAINMFGYIVLAILTTRTILVHKFESVDVAEYISFGLIYFAALVQYADEVDGMLFGALIVGVIVFSYFKKYGAMFMASIGAILVNAFILTRAFWFVIPWWVYLLAVGGTLIGFAVRNEMSDKKEEVKQENILKRIKDKVEKQ